MANFPRFAAPLAQEWRIYYRKIRQWFQNGSGPPTERPKDPLQPYRDVKDKRPKKLISLRIDEDLLELTKELARQHDMCYQAVIRLWIQEGLRQAIREGVEDPK